MEHGAGSAESSLVYAYGRIWDEPELTDAERANNLCDLLVRCLVDSREVRRLDDALGQLPALGFSLDGVPCGLIVQWNSQPIDASDLTEISVTTAPRPRLRYVIVSMAGFTANAMVVADARGLTLLDRPHVDAVLCGLMPLAELLSKALYRADFDDTPYTPLTALVVGVVSAQPLRLALPDRLPPRDIVRAMDGSRARVRHLFSGDSSWGEPRGITVDGERTLVTTAGGVVDVDLRHGTTAMLVSIENCRGNPLVRSDGAVLTLCGEAAVEWRDDVLTPIAGGLGDARALFAGPHGDAWVLAGNGATLGSGRGTLALVRLGRYAGSQHRWPIEFPADVQTATWLGGMRFFLAAPGHSATIDLAHQNVVSRKAWIVSPHPRPQQAIPVHPDVVVMGSPNPGGTHCSIYQVNVRNGASERMADVALNRLYGMAAHTADATIVLGGTLRDMNQYDPVLLRVDHFDSTVLAGRVNVAGPAKGEIASDPAGSVRTAARGSRRDYALGSRPIARGGQATVFRARHKVTGIDVAFKRIHDTGDDARARMRREVEAAQLFGGTPHVMPVLDQSSDFTWFVMPLAAGTAQTMRDELTGNRAILEFVSSICEGLRWPHQEGWVHRDLKPDNVLWYEGRWVIADWGLGRRPRGTTTTPRTRAGADFGTLGFKAPELEIDAHAVGAPADIYSIGQLIGWVLTGSYPQTNVPLLPNDSHWRRVVQATTSHDPDRRPQTVDELLDLIARGSAQLDRTRQTEQPAATSTASVASPVEPAAASRTDVRKDPAAEIRETSWPYSKQDRGNPDGELSSFQARSTIYWTLTAVLLLLGAAVLAVLLAPGGSVAETAVLGLLELLIGFLVLGFSAMARSPIRLEIGSAGIQLFYRGSSAWFPWHAIERVEVRRLTGNLHLVVWCAGADGFPRTDTLRGGPRFVPKLNAVAVCPLSIMSKHHLIRRALVAYGSEQTLRRPDNR